MQDDPGVDLGARDTAQLRRVAALVRDVLGEDALAAWLYGSAVSGGLRPDSDLDVLVVARRETSTEQKQQLIRGLLALSGRRAEAGPARSIELSVVVQSAVRPWRYPPALDFQYGDWWRTEFERGEVAPWDSPNPDLAVLIATARLAALPLFGPPVEELLDPVPPADLEDAMLDGIPGLLGDLDGDTRNVILTLARIWTTLATGEIRPKDAAADWVLERVPAGQRPVLGRARAIYLGAEPERWDDLRELVRPHAEYLLSEIRRVGGARGGTSPRD